MRPHLFTLQSVALLGALIAATSGISDTTLDAEHQSAFHSQLQCRCLPSQACWPSVSTWTTFNQTVGGRLIATTPAARECREPYYNKAKCDEIQENYTSVVWRQNQPGAIINHNWETLNGQGCLGANQTTPCHQGSVPLFTVNATNVADVQASIRFAAHNNIRLVVKNTGHCFLGRSIAPHSLNLWTHHMKDMQVADAFVPEGAPQGTQGRGAIVLGAGVQWKEAYKFISQYGREVVGGGEGSVGTSGGFCLGGGGGPLSPRYGLCVDNVLQYKIITANGELRVANAYKNKDLFWALRGGGPGFGVVVEAIYKTHPALKNVNFAEIIIVAPEQAQMDKVVQDFYARQPAMSDEGWAGLAIVDRTSMMLRYFLPEAPNTQAKASLKPFLDYARSIPGVAVVGERVDDHAVYYTAWQDYVSIIPDKSAGANTVLGTRLIPRRLLESAKGVESFTSALRQLQDDVRDFVPKGGYLMFLSAGGQVAKGNSKDTSVLPAWRTTLLEFMLMAGWSDDTPVPQQLHIQQTVTAATEHLRKITRESGTYVNEADPNEPDWQRSFFGSNYPRLRVLKHKYDPKGLFVCRKCVGSEDWDNDLMCPRRP
ncbi:hypothetical protein DFQ27_008910 [Actinomortierella ambigua]|uniref:FAD-binding PCMH-type domain-containing protein n=1 Tax=Actinomortierella ambigua TaxID=1343610 RepID=A0A9P6TXS8_9FUNG|nr:hypothetical protein DFQ27_008910 [Actinomortierella ambigua]